ncbi:UNVERIFIED_CONTAM: Guanylate cyclase 2G [Siphonaria sp. JEL0065]|nr:Guanylate cyclase 2G [Siphonaria sp. JEL0065]
MGFVWANFFMWLLAVGYNVNERLIGNHRTKAFNRGNSDYVYKGQAFVFFVSVCFAALGYVGTKSPAKRSMTFILIITNSVLCLSYFLQYLRAGITYVDKAGYPVDSLKFLEWAHGQANLVYFIGMLTSADSWSIGRAIFTTHGCILLGFLAAIARHPFDEMFATAAMAFYLACLQDIISMFQKAMDGEVDNNVDVWTLRRSRDVTVFSWTYIAFSWHMVRGGFWSFQNGELHNAIGEFIAKIVLMLLFVNNTVEESHKEVVIQMESHTTTLDERMAASDKLLQRMIPAGVLDQLKSGQDTSAEEYASVTVFFSDIANFTPLSQRTSAKDMLASLSNMWVEYDRISKKFGMYKVETIGDAFLGVVGAPERVPDHAERAVNFSLHIIEMIKKFRLVTGEPIQIRAGLNSGPVTGGILGESNPHWCIVGDTVTIASKMEATSEHMKIHISESTYNLIKSTNRFKFSQAPSVTIKGTSINSFFVEGHA